MMLFFQQLSHTSEFGASEFGVASSGFPLSGRRGATITKSGMPKVPQDFDCPRDHRNFRACTA